ncbi:MAG: 50S ribosomal protein L23 [Mycoplasmataceae bacterium]|jgi:large subunit ribosomal protein L23|nr:50S ribosomal protein L23 [Mycoplasmataceae bacterium]
MELTRIIIQPLNTEKSYKLRDLLNKVYTFQVNPKATKQEIALAFESIYTIVPLKVRTQLRKPAAIRTGTMKPGFTKLTKIAYITLPPGTDIAESKEEIQKVSKEKTPLSSDVTKKEVKKQAVTVAKTTIAKKEVAAKKTEVKEDKKEVAAKKTEVIEDKKENK